MPDTQGKPNWFAQHWELIATYAVMFLVSFVTLQFTTGANAKQIEKHEIQIAATCSEVAVVKTDVAVAKSEMAGLGKRMDNVQDALQELTREIRRGR